MKKLVPFVCILFVFAGCKIDKTVVNDRKIVCSTSIIADCVRQIVGEDVEVVSLMGPGIDPHAYNPRPKDVQELNSALLIVYNGVHLEGKMAELFKQLGHRKKVVAVETYYPKNQLLRTEDGVTHDPHIWFDPAAWLTGMEGVLKHIMQAFPEHAVQYKERFCHYRNRVLFVSFRLKNELSTIPKQQRILITSHDAFHYFGRSFDVQVKALQGISTTQEPSVRSVVDLVNFIVKNKVKALFVEHSVSPKAISTVVESCRKKGHQLKIGGTLYSDALSEPTKRGGTYLGMLQHNCRTIKNGLKP